MSWHQVEASIEPLREVVLQRLQQEARKTHLTIVLHVVARAIHEPNHLFDAGSHEPASNVSKHNDAIISHYLIARSIE